MSTLYSGTDQRLVLSFDVGTTFSGMSYCILDPGRTPRIRNITRFPGQEHISSSSKIPTLLYYDQEGNVKAAGFEVLSDEYVERAKLEKWLRVEWQFKVRMRPKSMPLALSTSTLPPLPPNKSVVHVYADFLAYLFSCARRFICDTHATISGAWDQLHRSSVLIIGHPNGWEGAQQHMLRQAAIVANLVPDTLEGRARVKFVTEGEASMHYCLPGGLIDVNTNGFIIADLGGGTLDFSAYNVTSIGPLRAEEVALAKSELEGSAFVTQRAKIALKERLQYSVYGADHIVNSIAERFDATTKKLFRSQSNVCFVAFGETSDSDLQHNIHGGKLRIAGEVVAEFFEPAIEASVAAILDQFSRASARITSVYLVGGFSASPYLVAQLKARMAIHNISVTMPDGQSSKAVADGALLFYLENFITSRVAKVSYCIDGNPIYDPSNPQHVLRRDKIVTDLHGRKIVRRGLVTLLQKGTSVSEETEYSQGFHFVSEDIALLESKGRVLRVFRGNGPVPAWKDELSDKALLKDLCVVKVDISLMLGAAKSFVGPSGKKYWDLTYVVLLRFGGPELSAQILWMENGIEHRSPAQIIYDEEANDDMHIGVSEPEMDLIDLTPAIGRLEQRYPTTTENHTPRILRTGM